MCSFRGKDKLILSVSFTVCVCLCVCLFVLFCVSLFVCMCVCVHVRVHVCVCVEHGISTHTAVPNHPGCVPVLLVVASVQEDSVGVAVYQDI